MWKRALLMVRGTGELLYDMYSVPWLRSGPKVSRKLSQAAYNKLLVHHVEKHSKTVGSEVSQHVAC